MSWARKSRRLELPAIQLVAQAGVRQAPRALHFTPTPTTARPSSSPSHLDTARRCDTPFLASSPSPSPSCCCTYLPSSNILLFRLIPPRLGPPLTTPRRDATQQRAATTRRPGASILHVSTIAATTTPRARHCSNCCRYKPLETARIVNS